MNAFEIAKELGQEGIIARIKAANLTEVGVYNEPVIALWEEAIALGQAENRPVKVVGALNNCDMEGAYLAVLEDNGMKVFEGLQIAGYMMDSLDMTLYVPTYASDLAERLKIPASEYGIQIKTGMVNVREEGSSSLNHLVTLKNVAECIEGTYVPGDYVAIGNGPLKKVPKGTKVKDILPVEEVKAIEAGYQLLTPEAFEWSLDEMNIDNGILRTMTASDCLVQITQERLNAYKQASCGKCVFCREGLIQLQGMVKNMTTGKAKAENMTVMKEIGEAMTYSNLCTIGLKSADILLSALDSFKPEFTGHIKRKCAADACSAFTNIYIDPKACTGCEECMDVCPESCIEGKSGFIHMIDDLDCTKCGKCIEACEEEAIVMTSGRIPKLPKRLTKVGKFRR